ncbi:MAG: hypothetical protein ACI8TQ_002027 [Planctomycetota bacterium]|jgi:hypothetical protein
MKFPNVSSFEYRPLFPELTRVPLEVDERQIKKFRELAESMLGKSHDEDEQSEGEDNPNIPAGYTYFGQFVAHDLSFTASNRVGTGFGKLTNIRTPMLDLDCLYGGGPMKTPMLYERRRVSRFLIAEPNDARRRNHHRPIGEDYDLPRNVMGHAIIADPRNDSNTMVSQMHLSMMMAHNRIADALRHEDESVSEIDLFSQARRELEWTYQWLALNEYLPRIVNEKRGSWVRGALAAKAGGHRVGVKYFKPWTAPFLPNEFVFAAFRYGHSTVRPSYRLNTMLEKPFPMTPKRGWESAPFDSHLSTAGDLPNAWTIDWDYFFDSADGGEKTKIVPQPSRLIDGRLSWCMGNLIDPRVNSQPLLPTMTLSHGARLGMPCGEQLADHLGENPLDERDTPLWLWMLREARQTEDGRCLGAVASTIVSEVLVALVDADPCSYLRLKPDFLPRYGTLNGLLTRG